MKPLRRASFWVFSQIGTLVLVAFHLAAADSAVLSDGRGAWTPTGDLVMPSYAGVAGLLGDGNVLLAGRAGNSDSTNSEIYEVATRKWVLTAPLNDRRGGHTLTVLRDGRALVTGGHNSTQGILSGAEVFDASSRGWKRVGAMGVARAKHTATLLPDGRLLIAGGYAGTNEIIQTVKTVEKSDGSSTETKTTLRMDNQRPKGQSGGVYGDAGSELFEEIYDSADGRWKCAAAMHSPRGLHTATLLTNGLVLVAGGMDVQDRLLKSAELFDPATGKWTEVEAMQSARVRHTATLLPNGKVLVVGGQDAEGNPLVEAELFDPVSRKWSVAGWMLFARSFHTATLLPAGHVLVAGGHCLNGPTRFVEIYNPASEKWSRVQPMGTARELHAAILLKNGKVLVAGGSQNGWRHSLSSAELFEHDPLGTGAP